MKEEIKICEDCASFKKNTTNENSNFKETNQMNYCLYKTVVFVARKNRGLLKMKKQD